MQLIKDGVTIDITPGELATILEEKSVQIKGGDGYDWMDLMGILISGIPTFIHALRMVDALDET